MIDWLLIVGLVFSFFAGYAMAVIHQNTYGKTLFTVFGEEKK